MRVLLDECVPHPLRHVIGSGHDVSTVAFRGWSGVLNGKLLRLMREAGIDILVTRDGNLSKQQNLVAAGIGVIVMSAQNNTLEALQPLVPAVNAAIGSIQPGEVLVIE